MSEAANFDPAQAPATPTPDMAQGQLLDALTPYRMTADMEARQQAQADKMQAEYRAREEAERKERYDLQQIVNRQTAIHAALMMEPKPRDAASLIETATAIHGFLIGS